MKYLLVLVVVMVGVWVLLRSRERDQRRPKPGRGPAQPADMVACAHCDLRLPRTEAMFDEQGRPFCDAAHRRAGPR